MTNDFAGFWNACRQKTFVLRKCSACGHIYWPPSPFCPACASAETDWAQLSGKGRVHSFVVFRRAFDPRLTAELPYVVATIRLDEGARIISNVINCPVDDVRVEMPVRLVWSGEGEETIPQFEPDPEQQVNV